MSNQTIITRKGDDVITNIVTSTQVVSNGLQVTDSMGTYIIAGTDQYNVYPNVDTGTTTVTAQQYKYTTAGGFVTNSNYVAPVNTNLEITDLQNGLLQAQAAINTLLGV